MQRRRDYNARERRYLYPALQCHSRYAAGRQCGIDLDVDYTKDTLYIVSHSIKCSSDLIFITIIHQADNSIHLQI